MKLLEFVEYLLDPGKLENFYHEQDFSPEAQEEGGIAIYMVGSTIELDADIRLLTSEETGGLINVQIDGINYVYVLEVDLAIDLIANSETSIVTNLDKANRILHYAIYDA